MTQYTQIPEKRVISSFKRLQSADLNKLLKRTLHRRALEFHQRLRQVRARLQNNRQRLVFNYIFDCTIGFNKLSDQISLSQFEKGKQNRKTGEVIDTGCGLTHNPIRQAKKELIKMGLLIEEEVANESGASEANRYSLRFAIELVKAELVHKKQKVTKHDTHRGYQLSVATIIPSEDIKQRCIETTEKKKNKNHYLHKDHVDFLVDEIEKATEDKHSRGGFAQIALTVAEGTIMELLHQLRDRGNIKNKGAWFIAAAKRYAKRLIVKADTLEAETSSRLVDWQNLRSQLDKTFSMNEVFAEAKPLPIYEQKKLLKQLRL